MNARLRRIVLCLLPALLLAPGALTAQWVDVTAQVTTRWFSWQGPTVRGYGQAVVYGPTGQRDYSVVVLGLEVWEYGSWWAHFIGRIISDQGIANYITDDMAAQYDACYYARAAGFSQRYNLREIADTSWYGLQCIPPPLERPDPPDENCPVLLDLEGDGYHLSGPHPAVRFDLDADGEAESIAWTKAGEDEAFLCLDRNGNGVIDDGRELFGYATPLRDGRPAIIGYRALGELDEPELGGNRDGRIDAGDELFSELCAWVDKNRNGVSEAHEIHTLAEARVAALDYHFKKTPVMDGFGNAFRYVSRGYMYTASGRVRSWPTYDVIFAAP